MGQILSQYVSTDHGKFGYSKNYAKLWLQRSTYPLLSFWWCNILLNIQHICIRLLSRLMICMVQFDSKQWCETFLIKFYWNWTFISFRESTLVNIWERGFLTQFKGLWHWLYFIDQAIFCLWKKRQIFELNVISGRDVGYFCDLFDKYPWSKGVWRLCNLISMLVCLYVCQFDLVCSISNAQTLWDEFLKILSQIINLFLPILYNLFTMGL